MAAQAATTSAPFILTPDQRLRVFVSSTLQELAAERKAVRAAVSRLHLSPVMFELGARPHPPRDLYRAYLAQRHIFVGTYWQRYGWIAPGEDIFWYCRSYFLEGAQWLERALDLSAMLADHAAQRARLLSAAGTLANERGDDDRAEALFEERLQQAQAHDDLLGQAAALNSLGAVAWGKQDYARAQDLIEASLVLRRESGQPGLLTLALNNLGLVALAQGKTAVAQAYLDECLALCRELGDTMGTTTALSNLGAVALETGDGDRAAALFEESLLNYRALGNDDGLAQCLEGFAAVAVMQGMHEIAARLKGAAEIVRETTSSQLSRTDAAWLERRLAPARQALGEEAFQANLRRGRSLTVDEGVETACSLSRR